MQVTNIALDISVPSFIIHFTVIMEITGSQKQKFLMQLKLNNLFNFKKLPYSSSENPSKISILHVELRQWFNKAF